MKCKRLIASLALCAVLVSSALPLRAAAASTDAGAVNAAVLELMGIGFGADGAAFSPDAPLTRAEFCVMVIKAMGRDGDVAAHTTRTIFRDVTARHWARGYINLAASIPVGGGSQEQAGSRLISGTGTGQFQPDAPITFAQAVTILMRVLGYSDKDVGAVWPAGYLNQAASTGLTNGVSAAAFSPVTHAQAAQLFVNLLSAKTKAGQVFCTTLGSAETAVLLLAVNVTGDDGLPGAVRTSGGVYHPVASGSVSPALQGLRGTLILNDREELVAFIPDGSSAVTVTLSGKAQALYLNTADGTRYAIAGDTPVFTGTEEQTTWSKRWMDLRSGAQVTLYLEGGKVTAVYDPSDDTGSTDALVAAGTVTANTLLPLTGGAQPLIRKNGAPISLAEIRPYDVLTYSPVSNTLAVSDLRLPCVYETAQPNLTTPETITVLGHAFPVLDCALDSIAHFKAGDRVVLLLTADGKVAGMAAPGQALSSTAIGLADASGVWIDLPDGSQIELQGSVAERHQNRVVAVSAEKGGKLTTRSIGNSAVPGAFRIADMTLGQYKVSAAVRVYEQTGSSAMVPVSLHTLECSEIPKEKIAAYHLGASGLVELLVLDAVTGDTYTYGILEAGSAEHSLGGLSASNTTVRVKTGAAASPTAIAAQSFRDGAFGGMAVGTREIGGVKVAADVVELTAVSGVRRTDFFEADGVWYVSAGGFVYPVSPEVEGYITATGNWFTQTEDRLAAIRAYSDNLTIHLDPIGHRVRIISVD